MSDELKVIDGKAEPLANTPVENLTEAQKLANDHLPRMVMHLWDIVREEGGPAAARVAAAKLIADISSLTEQRKENKKAGDSASRDAVRAYVDGLTPEKQKEVRSTLRKVV